MSDTIEAPTTTDYLDEARAHSAAMEIASQEASDRVLAARARTAEAARAVIDANAAVTSARAGRQSLVHIVLAGALVDPAAVVAADAAISAAVSAAAFAADIATAAGEVLNGVQADARDLGDLRHRAWTALQGELLNAEIRARLPDQDDDDAVFAMDIGALLADAGSLYNSVFEDVSGPSPHGAVPPRQNLISDMQAWHRWTGDADKAEFDNLAPGSWRRRHIRKARVTLAFIDRLKAYRALSWNDRRRLSQAWFTPTTVEGEFPAFG